LGEFTFVRLADTAIKNVVSLQRIQRIHGYYRSLVPDADQFFQAPPIEEEMAAVESTGVPRTPLGLLYTAASMISAVNSVLGGTGLALLGGRLGGLGPGPAVVVGVAGTLVLYGLHPAAYWAAGSSPGSCLPAAGWLSARLAAPNLGAGLGPSDPRPGGDTLLG
jgi:hypothetical protein